VGNDWHEMMGQMGSGGHWHWYGPLGWALVLLAVVILMLRLRGK